MKTKTVLRIRRFFRRFIPWLFLACVLMALVIWCVTMYTLDSAGGLETAEETLRAAVDGAWRV